MPGACARLARHWDRAWRKAGRSRRTAPRPRAGPTQECRSGRVRGQMGTWVLAGAGCPIALRLDTTDATVISRGALRTGRLPSGRWNFTAFGPSDHPTATTRPINLTIIWIVVGALGAYWLR